MELEDIHLGHPRSIQFTQSKAVDSVFILLYRDASTVIELQLAPMENEDVKFHKQVATVFADLLDSLIVDVASEAHRAARLGMDPRLNVDEEEEVRLSAQARSLVGDPSTSGLETSNKYAVDIFGQTHPAVATEVFECMNCGRNIMAGRFAPHLEKCMGKGRKARLKTRNANSVTKKRARSSPAPSLSTGVGGVSTQTSSRTPTRTPALTPEDSQRTGAEGNEGTSDDSHDDDEKVLPFEEAAKPVQGQAPKRMPRSSWRQT